VEVVVVGVEAEVDEVERDSPLVLIRLDCTLNVYWYLGFEMCTVLTRLGS
jgi:hypothetical protein